MLALFASAMMMVPSDGDSSEGACEAPNTTTAAPSSDVSLRLPATGVRPPAAPSPASSVGETPTVTLRTQAWRKGNVEAMWSVIEKGMFEDELGYLRVNSKGALEDLKPKARTQRLKAIWLSCVLGSRQPYGNGDQAYIIEFIRRGKALASTAAAEQMAVASSPAGSPASSPASSTPTGPAAGDSTRARVPGGQAYSFLRSHS